MWGREFREGSGSYKEGQAGELAGRQTVPSSSCCLHPPLTIPRKSCSWFCLQSFFILCQVRVVSSPWVERVEGSGLNLRQAQSRCKAPDTRQQQLQEPRGVHALKSAASLPRQHPGDGPAPRRWLGGPPQQHRARLGPYSTYWSRCILQASLHFHRFLLLYAGQFCSLENNNIYFFTWLLKSFCSRIVF